MYVGGLEAGEGWNKWGDIATCEAMKAINIA
jgi:hypothetical protein